MGHQIGKFCPKKGPSVLQWVFIKAFPMISRVYNNQSTQKRGNQGKKRESPTSKETNELPKRMDHKGNIKFPNPLRSQEAYQIRKGEDLVKGHLARKSPKRKNSLPRPILQNKKLVVFAPYMLGKT